MDRRILRPQGIFLIAAYGTGTTGIEIFKKRKFVSSEQAVSIAEFTLDGKYETAQNRMVPLGPVSDFEKFQRITE